jgi:hypothetical protein
MAFDPHAPPCHTCGRELDECVCGLAPDFPDDPIPELDTDQLDWDHYEEEDHDSTRDEGID